MGQGSRPFKPGSVMLREYSPKVVTTATSVWRTWKVNNMQMKITSSTAAVISVIRFRFISANSESFVHRGRFGGFGRQDHAAQQIRPDFFLQVQDEDVLCVRGRYDILADGFQGARQRVEPQPLGINGRRRLISC